MQTCCCRAVHPVSGSGGVLGQNDRHDCAPCCWTWGPHRLSGGLCCEHLCPKVQDPCFIPLHALKFKTHASFPCTHSLTHTRTHTQGLSLHMLALYADIATISVALVVSSPFKCCLLLSLDILLYLCGSFAHWHDRSMLYNANICKQNRGFNSIVILCVATCSHCSWAEVHSPNDTRLVIIGSEAGGLEAICCCQLLVFLILWCCWTCTMFGVSIAGSGAAA